MQVHTLFTGVANTHLIENSRGVIIIDAGMPHQASRILNKIRTLGYAPQDVRAILLTHGHIDHAGSAVALKRLTGAPILMHRADERLTTTPSLKIPPGRTFLADASRRLARRFSFVVPLETFAPDIPLDDGMSLRDLGIDARVVHTPGHTAGSVSFLFDDGTLFVGDTILNSSHVAFPLWWEDATATKASALGIRALGARTIYTGHGRAFDADALNKFVNEIEQGRK